MHTCSFWGKGSAPMKLCHVMGHRVGMITYLHFGGVCTPVIWEGQKLENLAWFWTTFEFDLEYLKNQSRYQNLETNLIEDDFYGIKPKIFGEVWSTNKKVTGMDVDPS